MHRRLPRNVPKGRGPGADLARFVGLKVARPLGEQGVIEGGFGQSGKFRVRFPGGLALQPGRPAPVTLTFKQFMFDPDKRRMSQ